MTLNFEGLFKNQKPVIGMIHVQALPWTPKFQGNINTVINKALNEAEIYKNSGIKAVMIENMHDIPYLNREVGHEISTLMSIIGYEIKCKTQLICGIQILAGANKAAIAAANSAGLDFIRSEGYVFAHVADEGYIQSDAGELKRYQKSIGSEKILIFNDIKKKHSSHSITFDVDIAETAKAAEFFMSDGVIITGKATGVEAEIDEVKYVKSKTKLPVLIGSGITVKNVKEFYNESDGLIIGSYFKKDGLWQNEIEEKRIENILKLIM